MNISEYSGGDLVSWEKEFYGGCVTFSPWRLNLNNLRNRVLVKSTELKNYINQEVELFGDFVTIKKVRTKEKESMCFCTFSDQHNVFETVFFPEAYSAFSDLLFEQGSYFVKGVVMSERGALQLQVNHLAFA